MIAQQLEETLATQPLFSILFNVFHSSFFYPVFGLFELVNMQLSHLLRSVCWLLSVKDLSDLVCI